MGESLLLTLILVFLAAIIVELCLPAFSSFTGKNFDWILSEQVVNISLLLLIAISVELLSGIYPSLYLTAFVPVHFLKNKTVTALSRGILRKVLVILQFALSIFLIIATLGIADQVRYIQNKNLGFKYTFLDEDYKKLYVDEEKMLSLFRIFTLLGILIACLGLLGLSGYLAEQRTKEIGIRKVYGSSSRQVFLLLNREITYQILISSLIAWPVTWLLLHRWLRNYPYHVDINLLFFFVATLGAALIAILITVYQSLSSAWKNPVDSLRYE